MIIVSPLLKYYNVRMRLKEFFFVIAVCLVMAAPVRAASSDTWRFVVTGDSRGMHKGVNAAVLQKLVPAIAAEQPRFVLFTGDLITGSVSRKQHLAQLFHWRSAFMEPLLERGIRTYPVRGNHDLLPNDPAGAIALWNKVFYGTYALPDNGPEGEKGVTYSFAYRNALFVGMDMYRMPHRVNTTWFDSHISSAMPPIVFVFAHEPAYASAGMSAHQDSMAIGQAARSRFLAVYRKAGAMAFFCGHDHWYDHAKAMVAPDFWFHQFTVGIAGAPLRVWSHTYREKIVVPVAHAEKYGYMVVDVSSSAVTFTTKVIDEKGAWSTAESVTLPAAAR